MGLLRKRVGFESQEEFEQYVRERCGADKAEEIIEHERAHLDKARELGYQAKYGVEVSRLNPNKVYNFFVYGAFVYNKKHLKEVCLAPKKPSIGDLLIVTGFDKIPGRLVLEIFLSKCGLKDEKEVMARVRSKLEEVAYQK
jgi:hypothetical protein